MGRSTEEWPSNSPNDQRMLLTFPGDLMPNLASSRDSSEILCVTNEDIRLAQMLRKSMMQS